MALAQARQSLASACHALLAGQSTLGVRSMAISVQVFNNNVDQALGRVKRLTRSSGLESELRKREYRIPNSEKKNERRKNTYNKKVGALIKERLLWLARTKS